VAALFELLLVNPDLLPAGAADEPQIPVHRQVCDYIAGMTDGYFRRVHAELLGSILVPAPQSLSRVR
ncbi:MAG: hypothetical protein H7039_08705, partial [Bryobacteraceae bacterium]|nr:hypothetical protein [Bryobacteraceae bacterium]